MPNSEYGKIVTMIYALLGIPVFILYFHNIGKVSVSQKLNFGKTVEQINLQIILIWKLGTIIFNM